MTTHLFAQLFVVARLKVLMYSSIHCAFSTRYASTWTKIHHALDRLISWTKIYHGLNLSVLKKLGLWMQCAAYRSENRDMPGKVGEVRERTQQSNALQDGLFHKLLHKVNPMDSVCGYTPITAEEM